MFHTKDTKMKKKSTKLSIWRFENLKMGLIFPKIIARNSQLVTGNCFKPATWNFLISTVLPSYFVLPKRFLVAPSSTEDEALSEWQASIVLLLKDVWYFYLRTSNPVLQKRFLVALFYQRWSPVGMTKEDHFWLRTSKIVLRTSLLPESSFSSQPFPETFTVLAIGVSIFISVAEVGGFYIV